jgi:hypothetical protein
MRGLFPGAVELLSDHTKSGGRCGVAVIDLLTSMLKMDSILLPFFVSLGVPRIVFALIYAYPEHTILHLSILDFLGVAFDTEAIFDGFLEEVVSVLLELFSEQNKALKFVLYKVVKRLIKASKRNSQLCSVVKKDEKFGELIKGPMAQYRLLLRMEYGGNFGLTADEVVSVLANKAMEAARM